MMKFEVHAPSYILQLEHGATPSRTGNSDMNRVGAKFGMAGEKCVATSQQNRGVAMVKRLNMENSRWRKIVEKYSSFDFRLDDRLVNIVREIGVRGKHSRLALG